MIRFVCSLRPFSVTLPFPGEEHGRTPVGPELREEFKAYPVINVLDQISHARRGSSLQWGRRARASLSGRDLETGGGHHKFAASGPAEQSGGKEKHRTGRRSDVRRDEPDRHPAARREM